MKWQKCAAIFPVSSTIVPRTNEVCTTHRILLVDDEPSVTRTFSLVLVDSGFEVDVFNDPIIALSNFQPDTYDLLLLDTNMPKMHGFELYDKMKYIDNKVKVCFLTTVDTNYKALREQFPSLDIECFIPKSIKIKELLSKIYQELEE